jgi:glutamyl-tRNA reductase
LARDFNGRALTWYQLEEALAWADAVICATGAPHMVIYRHDVEPVLPQRDGRALVFMDIAVPRDVEDTVRELVGVTYHDIDDLHSVVDAHRELRKEAVPQVDAIIAQDMTRFDEWHSSRAVTPVIKTLRDWGQSVADDELERTLNRLADADERTRELVAQLAHRLVNRLLHPPTARLRVQAAEGNGSGYAHAVSELFALQGMAAHGSHHQAGCCGAARQGDLDRDQCDLQCLLPEMDDAAAVERQ